MAEQLSSLSSLAVVKLGCVRLKSGWVTSAVLNEPLVYLPSEKRLNYRSHAPAGNTGFELLLARMLNINLLSYILHLFPSKQIRVYSRKGLLL